MPALSLSGTLCSGSGFGASLAYCRWRLLAGGAWTQSHGSSLGHSQTASAEGASGRLDFCQPLDATLISSSLRGWPQLLLSVWQVDSLGRHDIGAPAARERARRRP